VRKAVTGCNCWGRVRTLVVFVGDGGGHGSLDLGMGMFTDIWVGIGSRFCCGSWGLGCEDVVMVMRAFCQFVVGEMSRILDMECESPNSNQKDNDASILYANEKNLCRLYWNSAAQTGRTGKFIPLDFGIHTVHTQKSHSSSNPNSSPTISINLAKCSKTSASFLAALDALFSNG
jgi:hypothetical protein